MTSTEVLLKQAEGLVHSNPMRAEELYKEILNLTGMLQQLTSLAALMKSPVNVDKEQSLRDQELALIKLAELYRDQKYAYHWLVVP